MDKSAGPPDQGVSVADTAKWVAMYRAIESDRPDALFRDPFARRLAGARGEEILRRMPRGRAFGWPMVVRTTVIDELIGRCVRDRGVDLVVNLAAGFDVRPYRLDLPAQLHWIEVDYPATLDEKAQALAGETPRCRLERIGLDLADPDARRGLLARIGDMGATALVIAEGLMIYLSREQAGELAQDLHAVSNVQWWILDIAAPFILKLMARTWSRRLGPSATFRFAPQEGAAFYQAYGWRLAEYRSAWIEAQRLHREPAGAWIWKVLYPRYSRQEKTRTSGPMTGVVLLERER
jgi:methyltransferase (TIGR00027 family)